MDLEDVPQCLSVGGLKWSQQAIRMQSLMERGGGTRGRNRGLSCLRFRLGESAPLRHIGCRHR
jgi:hypothetical protein